MTFRNNVLSDDIQNNLSFFQCSSCGEDLIITVNKASVIKRINPNYMNERMEKEVIVTAKNQVVLMNSLYDDCIRSLVIRCLRQCRGNIEATSELIGRTPKWVARKIKKYGIVNVWSDKYLKQKRSKGCTKLSLREAEEKRNR